eukprot:08231.XXX_77607_77783_1 [CDS] Oithona nana genome sequencing.
MKTKPSSRVSPIIIGTTLKSPLSSICRGCWAKKGNLDSLESSEGVHIKGEGSSHWNWH